MELSVPTQNFWINGELMGSGSQTTSTNPFDTIARSFDGEIAELLIFSEDLNFVNRQKVEAYLAHKWQLEDRLPELHPYYDNAPAFGGNQYITWLGVNESNDGDFAELPVKAVSDPDFSLSAIASSDFR